MARTITIIVKDGNHFDVHEGERYSDRLCWEEMLGQIATMTHPAINAARFPMETPEEHAARRARYTKTASTDADVVDAEIVSEPIPPHLTYNAWVTPEVEHRAIQRLALRSDFADLPAVIRDFVNVATAAIAETDDGLPF